MKNHVSESVNGMMSQDPRARWIEAVPRGKILSNAPYDKDSIQRKSSMKGYHAQVLAMHTWSLWESEIQQNSTL
jgi:hypothetical protein